MPNRGDRYVVQVKPSHIKWGEYRNPTNRAVIQRESYVKIPAGPARDFGLVRGTHYTAHFTDGRAPLPIKAAGNGPERDGVRYAKQFEGVGRGACKAFTPWYQSGGVQVGDRVEVEFLSPTDVQFTLIKATEE